MATGRFLVRAAEREPRHRGGRLPRLGRRAVRFGGAAGSPGTMAVYPLDAEVPLFPRK